MAEEEPVRPSAGALILASLDGVDSCGVASNHTNAQVGPSASLSGATPVRNTPQAFERPELPTLQLTFWSVVADEWLGAGERVDGMALGELGAALRVLLFMPGATRTSAACTM